MFTNVLRFTRNQGREDIKAIYFKCVKCGRVLQKGRIRTVMPVTKGHALCACA